MNSSSLLPYFPYVQWRSCILRTIARLSSRLPNNTYLKLVGQFQRINTHISFYLTVNWIDLLTDLTHLGREKARADAEFYKGEREAEIHKVCCSINAPQVFSAKFLNTNCYYQQHSLCFQILMHQKLKNTENCFIVNDWALVRSSFVTCTFLSAVPRSVFNS